MKKEDMIDAYAKYYGVTKGEARIAMDRIPDFITRMLKDYKECSFNSYMKFTVHMAEPRKYYNVKEGKLLHSEGKSVKINCKIRPTMRELVGDVGEN